MDRETKNVATRARRKPATARSTSSASPASDLRDARAQQAAVNEILRVMADAPADVTVVLNAIAKEAAQLCHAPFARVTVIQDGMLHPLAGYALDGTPRPPATNVPLSRTSVQGRALLDRKTLHYADIVPLLEAEFPDARETHASWASAPCSPCPCCGVKKASAPCSCIGDRAGTFHARPGGARRDVRAASRHRAAQRRASSARRRMRSSSRPPTSEILRVISGARNDVQPVFDTIARSALDVCRASSSVVVTLADGLLHIRAPREHDQRRRRRAAAASSRDRRAATTARPARC